MVSLKIVATKIGLLLFHPDRDGGFNRFPRAFHHFISLSLMVSIGSTLCDMTFNLFELLFSWPLRNQGLLDSSVVFQLGNHPFCVKTSDEVQNCAL